MQCHEWKRHVLRAMRPRNAQLLKTQDEKWYQDFKGASTEESSQSNACRGVLQHLEYLLAAPILPYLNISFRGELIYLMLRSAHLRGSHDLASISLVLNLFSGRRRRRNNSRCFVATIQRCKVPAKVELFMFRPGYYSLHHDGEQPPM